MEVDQIAHGIHVVPQRQAELVFAVALPLERKHHLLHRRAPPAHAAEALPQALRHAPQRLLHGRLALQEVPGSQTGRGHFFFFFLFLPPANAPS